MISSSFRRAQEVYVPHLENGSVQYLARETISAGDRMDVWILKDTPPYPLSTLAKAHSINAITMEDGLDTHQPSRFDF